MPLRQRPALLLFMLPPDLAPGDATVTVRVRGAVSNPARVRIEAPGN